MKRFEAIVTWFNDRLIGSLSRILAGVAAVALVIIALMITLYIFVREMTPTTFYFVEEWTEILTVLVGYFAFAYALKAKRHIIVDMIVRHISEMTRRVLELFTGVVGMFVVAFTLQRGISFMQYNWVHHIVYQGVMRTPMWIPTLFIVLGLAIFVLAILGYNLQKIVELVDFARKRRQLLADSKG